MACKKNDATPAKLSTSDMAQRLYTQKDFVDFAGSFAKNFKYLADYYQSPSILNNKETFIQTLRNAGDDEASVEAAHAKFGLSLKEITMRKYLLDNDVLQLYHSQPELLNYNEHEFWSIIKQSITLLKQSSVSNLVHSNSSGIASAAISLDEVWDCLKGAVGLGGGSMLGIAGLHALAQKKGIQKAVVSFAAIMAKNLGYIGLAITVFDFSSCMYKESMD
jgi:hypothetical protein